VTRAEAERFDQMAAQIDRMAASVNRLTGMLADIIQEALDRQKKADKARDDAAARDAALQTPRHGMHIVED
jgi:hypothetical protein